LILHSTLSDIKAILRRLESTGESTGQPPPRRYSADEHPVKGKRWDPEAHLAAWEEADAVG